MTLGPRRLMLVFAEAVPAKHDIATNTAPISCLLFIAVSRLRARRDCRAYFYEDAVASSMSGKRRVFRTRCVMHVTTSREAAKPVANSLTVYVSCDRFGRGCG